MSTSKVSRRGLFGFLTAAVALLRVRPAEAGVERAGVRVSANELGYWVDARGNEIEPARCPGCQKLVAGGAVAVESNGKQVNDCFAADTSTGKLRRWATLPDGRVASGIRAGLPHVRALLEFERVESFDLVCRRCDTVVASHRV